MLFTERLKLRPFTLDDLEFLFKLDNDKVVNQYRSTSTRTIEFCENQINNWNSLYDSTVYNVHLIETMESGNSIGLVFLVKQGSIFVLGYRLLSDYWRKGYAYEVCKSLLEEHFRTSSESVYAETHPYNEASVCLLVKLGFVEITEENQEDSRLFELRSSGRIASGSDSS